MKIARIADVLIHTATVLVLGGIAAAMTGAALNNALYLFDVGMWMQIAAVPVYAIVVALYITSWRYFRRLGAW